MDSTDIHGGCRHNMLEMSARFPDRARTAQTHAANSLGLLEVYIPEATYILALKLLAGRQKDRGDIQDLCYRTAVYILVEVCDLPACQLGGNMIQ